MRRSAFALLAAFLCAGMAGDVGAQQPRPTTVINPALALAALDRKIADLDIEEQSSRRELTALAAHVAESHRQVIAHGRTFYRLTRAGMLPVGGGFDELVTHAMHVERARRTLVNDLAIEKKLRSRAQELTRGLDRVAKDRVTLATQRTSMDAARLAMEDEQRRQVAFDSGPSNRPAAQATTSRSTAAAARAREHRGGRASSRHAGASSSRSPGAPR